MNRLAKEAHALEDINGVRCAVVEKNVSPERTEFLKKLLEFNGYTVMVAPSPPPKKPTPALPKGGSEQPIAIANEAAVGISGGSPPPSGELEGAAPSTFTVGVTDFLFHTMLIIYERALKTPEGKLVTIDYWNQQPEKEGAYYWKRDFFTNSL